MVTTDKLLARNVIAQTDQWSKKGKRTKFNNKLGLLKNVVFGCDIWSSDYVHGPLDQTNDRIYSEL